MTPLGTSIRASIALALLALPAGVAAQDATPLQKSDVIRMLSGTTYSKAEVAEIIRGSCLSFTPTERDRQDFRQIGADDRVFAAIDGCLRDSGVSASVSPAAPVVEVGDTARLTVRLERSGAPAAGERVVLQGTVEIRGGPGRNLSARTGPDGRATFEFAVGTAARRYGLRVAVEGAEVRGGASATLTVRAGPPAAAAAEPGRLLVQDGLVEVRVSLRDRFDNPVAGAPVALRTAPSPDASAAFTGATGPDGAVAAEIPAGALAGVERLHVMSGGSELGTVEVVEALMPAERIRVVAPDERSGEAGRTLAEPLVVEVVDAAGAPAGDVPVRFTAAGGSVRPDETRTGADGRAATSVTLGSAAETTVVTVAAAGAERTVRFRVTRGGLPVAELQRLRGEAEAALEAGDHQEAQARFRRLLEAEPGDLDARIGLAESYRLAGAPDSARARFRDVLRVAPSRRDAQLGMARSTLAAGEPEGAIRWFELALAQERNDPGAWVELGRARARAGRRAGAREAFRQALTLEPGRPDAQRELRRLEAGPIVAELSAWGGNTFDNGRDVGPRRAEVRVYPGASLDLWGGYDNALALRQHYLVRGSDDVESFYGGMGIRWGEARALSTTFEFRRAYHSGFDETQIETRYGLHQQVRFGSGGSWTVEGVLAHWWDRDDITIHSSAVFPVGSGLRVGPRLSYGKNRGSRISVTRLAPARDFRFGAGIDYVAVSGWSVEAAVSGGDVDSELDEFDGGLFDAFARFGVAVGTGSRIEGYLRYQSPPGLDSFTTVGLGVTLGIPRGR